MGKRKNESRTCEFVCRMTPSEAELFRSWCEKLDLSYSEFLRKSAIIMCQNMRIEEKTSSGRKP